MGTIIDAEKEWKAPEIPEHILHGDMPGDKVEISQSHIKKAAVIFPELLKLVKSVWKDNPDNRAVVTVCGGSGVGKSEIASLLSFFFSEMGVGSYTLSGDNYPHRIPKYNDAERLRVFRAGALKGMIAAGDYTSERFQMIQSWQKVGMDADQQYSLKYPWYESYLTAGRKALKGYLGSKDEIDFDEIGHIVERFKNGESQIWLKRMGRVQEELWYDLVDFSGTQVLVIEWTHGNSDEYKGVDIPVLLNSTPAETLEHRRNSNRDGAVDSPFTTMVLELEQEMLKKQAHKAKIILSKGGELMSYDTYQQVMNSK